VLLVAGGLAIAFASGAGSRLLNEKVAQFKDGGISKGGLDRLLSTSSNGRLDHWSVALDSYKAAPFHGSGAGTYELAWDRDRNGTVVVQNAHSLYLETLAELGWSGLLLLGVALLGILVGFARPARGAQRPLYAALFAAGFAWVLASAVDWDWQMPAVTLWLFAAGGLALAAPWEAPVRLPRVRSWARFPALAGCVLLALAPLRVLGAETHINRAVDAADTGNCAVATREAASAANAIPSLAKPAVVAAYCAVRDRRPRAAVAPLRRALAHDRGNWELWYDLAVVRAKAGLPARRQTLIAQRLNAHDAGVQKAVAALVSPEGRRDAKLLAALTPLTP
jgi:hypothetical protein